MRLARSVYVPFFDKKLCLNVGNILFEYEGAFVDVENIPDSYLKDKYGFTKDELASYITEALELDFFDSGGF
jgi:hypothetical protein